ncbi:MAG: hypothetical protein K6E59_02630 [Bacilli bacterium]|nr:hypothetical protein [Bacilli bacterium]
MKNKKPLFITLIALDVAITAFFFVIHIIMLINLQKTPEEREAIGGLIGWLMRQENNGFYLGLFVIPLFLLLAANVVGLVIYVRKTTKKEPVKVNDLTEEQREALRAELLKDLTGDAKPQEEAKPEDKETPAE